MKNKSLKIVGMMALGLVILVFACSKEEVFHTEPELLSFEQFEVYGDLHNQFMTNVNENFVPNESIETLDDALNYIDDFQQSFLAVTDLKGIDRIGLSNARTTGNNESTLPEIIEQANLEGLLDEFEYQSLVTLGQKVKMSYKGLLSESELQAYVEVLQIEWVNQGYTVESEYGQTLAFVLSISRASLEWWEENPDAGLTTNIPNGRVAVLPAWAAADIGGAIVGGAWRAINSYQRQLPGNRDLGNIDWEGVGRSALGGAIIASTGASIRLGGWLTSIARRIGS